MSALIEPNQVGVREDLSDLIAVADMKETPFSSQVKKGTAPNNMRIDHQADDELSPDLAGVLDGDDVTNFGNPAENRAVVSVYAQKFRDAQMIGDLAQNVSNVAGLSKGEKAKAIAKSIRKVKRSIEAQCLSDNETAAQSGATAYSMRGLGQWILATAQAVLPVDANFRTPSASIDTTASTAAATEAAINTVLESMWNQTGAIKDFDGYCGGAMRKRISDLQLYDANASAGTAYIAARHVSKTQQDNVMAKRIDIIVGDFGSIKLHSTNFAGYSSNTRTAAVGNGRFYILDMKDIMLRFSRTPGCKELPDLGGGPRFLCDAVCALTMGSPLKHGAFKPTTA